MGSDCRKEAAEHNDKLFKLTLPCGERPRHRFRVLASEYLNSRSPVGSDGMCRMSAPRLLYLNSRSPVGSDCMQMRYYQQCPRFKLTLPCGERRLYPSRLPDPPYLNSRSPVGSDVLNVFQGGAVILFKLTLPCGERQSSRRELGRCCKNLNSRSPVGSDFGRSPAGLNATGI